MRISISGLPGSGTSTVADIISQSTGFKIISAGVIFRKAAKDRGLSLAEFGKLAEERPVIDIELDKLMMDEAKKEDDIILEGRLAGEMCAYHHVEAFKVWIDADIEERARRVVNRESKPLEQVVKEIEDREECEWKRYMDFYEIDLNDMTVYEIVVDSTQIPAAAVAEEIMNGIEAWTENHLAQGKKASKKKPAKGKSKKKASKKPHRPKRKSKKK